MFFDYLRVRQTLHEAGPRGCQAERAPMSWSAGARSWQGSPPRCLPALTVQDPKMEVLLPITELARANGNLGTYLASFPSCHAVLHFHGFNHTNFLTFCYLEKQTEKRQVLQLFWFCNNTQGWSHQETIRCSAIWPKQQQRPLRLHVPSDSSGGSREGPFPLSSSNATEMWPKWNVFLPSENVQIWHSSTDRKIYGFRGPGRRGEWLLRDTGSLLSGEENVLDWQ